MSDQLPVLKARSAVQAEPMSVGRDTLDVRMQTAVAIAKAGDMLPRAYRGQPGAILLAIDWAERHDLAVMDAIHGVAWVQGRPVVDSTLQRAMARNAGYDVRVTEATDTKATVRVLVNGSTVVGTASYTIDEARAAGLTSKDNWKRHTTDMLVARATTRAIKWFCAEALIGGALSPDEVDDLSDDPVTVLTATAEVVPPGPAPEPVVSDPVPAPETRDDDIEDAELVDVPDDTDRPATAAEKGATKASLEIVKGNGAYQAVTDAMKAESIPMAATKWTGRQALRIQELCDLLGGA
jgi:hypothetical protein